MTQTDLTAEQKMERDFPIMACVSRWLGRAFSWLPQEEDKGDPSMMMLAMLVFIPVLVVTIVSLVLGVVLELVTALPRWVFRRAKVGLVR